MTDIYYMPRENSVPKSPPPPPKLLVVIIRDFPRKIRKAMNIFKEYLNGTHCVNQYCYIKLENHSYVWDGHWHIVNVKPSNIYVFPYSKRFADMLGDMVFKTDLIEYVYTPWFNKVSNDYPVQYMSSLGCLLVEEENIENIRSTSYDW